MISKKGLLICFLFATIFWMMAGTSLAQNDNRVPFKHRVGNPAPEGNLFRIRGDFTMIGNTNNTLANYGDTLHNSNTQIIFVDVDKDSTTFNSSASTLVFSQENGADPYCTEILYAGLYWSGRVEIGRGLIFEMTKVEKPGIPQDASGKEQEVYNQDLINFTHYQLGVGTYFDGDGLMFPVIQGFNYRGPGFFSFRFLNSGTERVQYSFDEIDWFAVENLEIDSLENVIVATFDPITFTDRGVTFTVDQVTRTIGFNPENFIIENNSIHVTTSGTFIPLLPHTVQFDKRKLKLKGPGSTSYSEITAAGNNILFPSGELQEMYVGYADVTDYVKSQGMGEYTVADIALTEGQSDNTGFYGNWGMIVIYQNSKMDWRDVTVFDGYSFVQSLDGQEYMGEIEINGFGAVKQGQVDLKLGVMAGEGDNVIKGDFLEIINQAGEWTRLQHPLNDSSNFFNSSIYTPVRNNLGNLVQNPRNPSLLNNSGIDIAQWDIPNPDNSIIANEQSSTRFRFGTRQDVYSIYALAFSVKSYSPVIQALNQIESINGVAPGTDPSVKPGEEIAFNLEIRNLGEESSEQTRIVIPIPHTATFVSANTIPANYGTVSFDPNIGLAGAIIWDMGDVPLTIDPNEVIATLQYRLKITEDCFVLANDNCQSLIAINGSVSGVGSISESVFNNIPFIQGVLEGTCIGEEITGPLEIPIVGRAEFAAANCAGYEPFSGLGNIELPDFCQGSPPTDLLSMISPSQEGYTIYFFTQETGGEPLFNYQVNTGVVGTEEVWVSEGPVGSCTGFRVPLLINVIPRSIPAQAPPYENCISTGFLNIFQEYVGDYMQLYYVDNNPLTKPMDELPKVDLSIPGNFSVWVSQIKEGECESQRREIKILLEDCSLRPAINVTITADRPIYTAVGEVITFTIVVKNTGGVVLNNVVASESLSQDNWSIPTLAVSDSVTFTTTYTISASDMDNGQVTNYGQTVGYDVKGNYVFDDDVVQIVTFPPGFLNHQISMVPENCLPSGNAFGLIEIRFLSLPQTGTYTIVRQEDGLAFAGNFENVNIFRAQVPPGTYEVTLIDVYQRSYQVPGTFTVENSQKVQFTIPEEIAACLQYTVSPESDQNLIFTLNGPDGANIPGSSGSFVITKSGTYSITGRDPLGILCPVEKSLQAEISQPGSLNLEVMPFCNEDVFTHVHLLHNTNGFTVKWYKIEAGVPVYLSGFDDNLILIAQQVGEYEVTMTDGTGCLIGVGRIAVAKSVTQPIRLNSLYTLCPTTNVNESIQAGSDFVESRWYLDGVEVSNSLAFSPKVAGLYSLVSKDRQGCEFFAEFEVEIKCEPTIRYSNAIIPNNPDRAFKVYPDNLTEEIEILIYSRWGELIYYCDDPYSKYGDPSSCVWDGTVNNKPVTSGNYLLIIRYKIKGMDLVLTEKSSILVLD
jgi:uncharacterized repeat protein (TIGR01451 family)